MSTCGIPTSVTVGSLTGLSSKSPLLEARTRYLIPIPFAVANPEPTTKNTYLSVEDSYLE